MFKTPVLWVSVCRVSIRHCLLRLLCSSDWINKYCYLKSSLPPCFPGSPRVWQKTRPNKRKRHPTFPFCFCLRVFCCSWVFFLPRHGRRLPFRHPSPSGAPLLWLCRGVLQARHGDGMGWCHPQSSVLARGQFPSPRGPPRHHWTKLERRDLPVSGKCPGSSQNQPAAVRGQRKSAARGQRKPATVR